MASSSEAVPLRRPLRYFSLWRALGWLLVMAVVVASLMPVPERMSASVSDKVGHVLAYAALMFWFAQLYSGARAFVTSAFGFFALGVVLEWAQSLTGYRSYELLDMLANGTGVMVGLVLALTPLGTSLRWFEQRVLRLA